MRTLGVCLAALSLAACGGGGAQDQLSITSLTQEGDFTYVQPAASTGFATATDRISDLAPGTSFTGRADHLLLTETGFDLAEGRRRVTAVYEGPEHIVLTVNGTRYDLTYDSADDAFIGNAGGQDAALLVTELNPYAAAGVLLLEKSSTPAFEGSLFAGIWGFTADPAALPARARYEGTAVLSAIPAFSEGDQSEGTVTMDADFANAHLMGQIVLNDTAGDTSGPVDLGNTAMIFEFGGAHPPRSEPMIGHDPSGFDTGASGLEGTPGPKGIYDGNSFATGLVVDEAAMIASGLTASPDLNLRGAFYGPTGEYASGQAMTQGSAQTGEDVVLFLSVDAQQQ